ncbi:hypothetical protein V6R21_20435 [Limibacter armeniacum]|uniref:hypothetical protein n=1 Tax=Limibacter armeniacum TaxID=466084 RepID=UPI002FE66A94
MKSYTLIILFLSIVASCDGIEDEVFNQDDIISIQLLNVDGDSLRGEITGNGESIIKVIATIPANADEQFRTVKFKTSAGTFTGITADASIQQVNVEGIAEANLRVPLTNNDLTIYVSAEIGSGGELYVADTEFNVKKIDQVISVELLSLDGSTIVSNIPADGETLVLVKSSLLVNTTTLNQITLETTHGNFIGAPGEKTMTPDADGVVSTQFKMPNTVDPITIKASTGSDPIYISELTFQPIRSYPKYIFIEPEKLTMNLKESNAIKVFLRRDIGEVTQGLPVAFKAFQILNDANVISVGRFTGVQNSKSDAEGNVSVTFHADTGDINTASNIIILVETLTGEGLDTLRNSIEINVIN